MVALVAQPNQGGFFSEFVEGVGDVFGGIKEIGSAISPALPGIAGTLLTKEAYDRLSDIGEQSILGTTVGGVRIPGAMEIAERGQAESQFKPFTVTTPTGAMFTARMGGQPSMGQPMPQPVGQPSMMLPPLGGVGSGAMSRGDQLLQNLPQMMQTDPALKARYDNLFQNAIRSYDASPMIPQGGARFAAEQDAMQQLKRSIMDQERLGIAPGDPLTTGQFEATSYMPPGLPQPTTGGLEVGMTLSPQEQALQQQLLGGAGGFFGQAVQPTVDREQAIFERMRAAQRPEEERQRLALEERLAAQGRLGTSSAAYGGATPEQLAMATAQEEARTRSMLGAMQQAQAEQMQQAGLGQQFLGAGYIPQAQLLAATQPAQRMAELQQQAQLYGTGLFGETAMSGLESRLLAEQARANLLGGIGSNVLAGLFTPQVTKSGTVIDPGGFGDLGGLFDGISSGLGSIGRAIGIID
jgi:hypothetical protein